MPLGLAIDKAASSIRVNVTSAIASVTAVGTVTTVTTCSTVTTVTGVTTVSTLANQTNIGGFAATSIVGDSMNTRWATAIRDRIT
jgi:hypothetical protein